MVRLVLFDWSGHFGRSDWNVPFHLTIVILLVPLSCILLTNTINKRAVAWVRSAPPECTVPLDKWNFQNFKPEFLLNGKRSLTRDSQIEVFCCIGYIGHWTHQNNKTFSAPAFLKSRKWARSGRSFQSLPLIAAYRYLSYSGIQIFQQANLFKLSLAFTYSI